MKPSGACFEFGPNGYFAFERAFAPQTKMKLLGVFSGFYEQRTVFDAGGRMWRLAELRSRHKTPFYRLLVHLFYNPWVDVEFLWHAPVEYPLDDLRAVYLAAVDADDDILTQFMERKELKKEITAATSFDELSSIYQRAQRERT